jgi:effector-binding domain-containing protein
MLGEIKIEQLTGQPVLSMRGQCAHEAVAERLKVVLPATYNKAVAAKLGPGRPFARYHGEKGNGLDIEAGFMVQKAGTSDLQIKAAALPPGPAATVVYTGSYEGLAEAHQSLRAWAAKAGRTPNGGAWEVYLNDPAQLDSSQWKTQIFLPLK